VDRSAVNVLSLCAGGGGLDLGVRLALPDARTVCAVEIEAYACEVLASRMEEGRLDAAPIWTDLRTFDGRPWRGLVDLVIGGYPCQPFSLAGARLGADDPRHLWPHVARILRESEAPAAFFENVRGHVSLGLREVRAELEGMGYRVDAEIVRAEEVGAPHRRERVFILAYSDGAFVRDESGRSGGTNRSGAAEPRDDGEAVADTECTQRRPPQLAPRSGEQRLDREGEASNLARGIGEVLVDADSAGLERRGVCGFEGADECTAWPPGPADADGWRAWLGPQPAVRRDADGVADRVERLRLCGNGVVPQQAALAFELLRRRAMTRSKAA
jgi:DNA (cytosine-5)-methyltransferase 1